MSKPLHWKETKMAFVDVGIGTAMLYGAMAGAGAGAIYNGVQGKNVLNGALIGGLGGAALGGGAAALAGAGWAGGAAAADSTGLIGTDIASMQAAGASYGEVSGTLQATYGMTEAQANAAIAQTLSTGSTAGGINMAAANSIDAINGITGSVGAKALTSGPSGAPIANTVTQAPQVSAASTPTQVANAAAPSAAANTPQANTSFFKHPLDWMQANPGSTAAGLGLAGLMGYGIYGNKGNNLLPQYNAVQPTKAMSSTLSPNYRGYFQAKEGGIARLAEGGTPTITSMTPDVAPAAIGPANQPAQLSAATQQLLSQYGVNPQQAQQGISALQGAGLTVKPAADGGLMQNGADQTDFMGQSAYPMSQQVTPHYATPSQMPTSAQSAMASYEPNTNPLTGEATAVNMASGGIAGNGYHLGGYSDGGRLLKGPGDGMSDEIPATIGHKQPARLADGEFVVPADVVSHLGNGSTDAGAKHLYKMMDKVRTARTGNKKQGKQIKADKFLPK